MGIKKRELLKMIEELAIAGVNLEKEVVVLCKAVKDQAKVIHEQNRIIDSLRNPTDVVVKSKRPYVRSGKYSKAEVKPVVVKKHTRKMPYA